MLRYRISRSVGEQTLARVLLCACLVPACSDDASDTSDTSDAVPVCDETGQVLNQKACEDGACAPNDASATAYALWKQEFLSVYGIDEAHFADHVMITDVNYIEAAQRLYIKFRFTVDWTFTTEHHTLELEDLEASIQAALNPDAGRYEITEIASPAAVQDAFDDCSPSLSVNWCYSRFRQHGELAMFAYGTVAETGGCREAVVDLISGVLLECHEIDCTIG